MCGRYVSTSTVDEVAEHFDASVGEVDDLGPRYNVAPTLDVYVVGERIDRQSGERERLVRTHRWGLVPSWADDPRIGSRLINARSESITDKPAYRKAFARRRCIVPADAFYEWQAVPGQRRKQPYLLRPADGAPLAFAGVWEIWSDAEGNRLRTCALITTAANADVRPVHDRMPVVLPEESWDAWLDPDNDDLDSLQAMLVPAADGSLRRHPVSTEVNNARNEGPELIEPVPEPPEAGDSTPAT